MELAGRKAIVTGAARGCGVATARAYAREGADVVLFDLNDTLGNAVAEEINAAGRGKAIYCHCDISSRADVEKAFGKAHSFLGGLDILAHVAGITAGYRPAETLDSATWDHVFDVNMSGTLHVNQAACLIMKDRGYGKIINFASAAGVFGSAGGAAYAASKGAVIAFTRTVAREWGRYGIRVNIVNPIIETPLRHETIAASKDIPPSWLPDDTAYANMLVIRGATGLKGDADIDMAPVMVFLASAGSDFMTGQMFNIDGGIVMPR